jgi:hypothetical protein
MSLGSLGTLQLWLASVHSQLADTSSLVRLLIFTTRRIIAKIKLPVIVQSSPEKLALLTGHVLQSDSPIDMKFFFC